MPATALQTLFAENIRPRPGRRPWHGGPTLEGALRGVDVATARWVPAPGRKSIWALALHVAFWDWSVWRRLEGRRDRFPRSRSDWPDLPADPGEEAWARDRALVAEAQERLLAAVARVRPAELHRAPRGATRWTRGELIVGVAQHEAYHLGQIQLVKRLAEGARGIGP